MLRELGFRGPMGSRVGARGSLGSIQGHVCLYTYKGSRFLLQVGGWMRGSTKGSARGPYGPKNIKYWTETHKIRSQCTR